MSSARNLHPATRCVQALGYIDPATKAIVPPLHAATTFERDPDNRYSLGFSYGRNDAPTTDILERILADLEGAEDALSFGSGMAAATTLFMALKPGDHVLAPTVMYWGLKRWLNEGARAWGLEVEFIPPGDLDILQRSLKPGRTKLVWLETPTNPTWEITDIAAASRLAHAAGALVAVDSTVATPVHTRPIERGADFVMHSATKYLNGHSDVLGGALMAARANDAWARIRRVRTDLGGTLGAFEAWLLIRGLRTLFLRVRQASAGAMAIAERLARHPKLIEVLYPGLPSHPGHTVAKAQMQDGFGGMMSIRVKGGEAAAVAVAARLKVFTRATSLGGVESLVEHRASIEGPGTLCPPDLLRLSIGIEDPADLVGDLEQALEAT
jgi:cystathionine gamma-synthase